MTRTTPPTLRSTLVSSGPWLVAIGFGALAHASYWLGGEPTVHVVPVPVPPPVVHIEAPAEARCPPVEPRTLDVEPPRSRHPSPRVDVPGTRDIDAAEAVRCEDDEVCIIDRRFLMTPRHWYASARLVPMQEEGEIVGVKLYGVREGGLFHAMGFRSGDAILAIDERPVRGMDDLMSAYTRLRLAQAFTLDVRRAGRMSKRYFRLE